MRRFSTLIVVMGLVLLVLVAPASATEHSASVSPSSGLAGSAVTVSVTGFFPNATFQVHEGSLGGTLLGTGSTDGAGGGSVSVTIPSAASPGPYTLAVCHLSPNVNCGDEFSLTATTTFNVSVPPPVATIPATTPTVTVPPLDLTPDVTPAGPCVIPDGAIRIDFDDLPTGDAMLIPEIVGPLARDEFYLWQLDRVVANADGTFTGFGPPLESGFPIITDLAARTLDTDPPTWLGSSSAPNTLRTFDEAHFSVVAYRALPAEMDYFGFNIGFGHYSEGFEQPEYVQYDVSIRLLPMYELDGTITEASWSPVTVTLGPGPQAVNTCVLLENTAGVGNPVGSTWLIDVIPRRPDGTPLHLPLEMDDVFYGTNAAAAVSDEVAEPTTTTSEPIETVATTTPPAGELESTSDLLLVLLAGLGGLLVGGGAIWLLGKRST